jgi:hypothetical protein
MSRSIVVLAGGIVVFAGASALAVHLATAEPDRPRREAAPAEKPVAADVAPQPDAAPPPEVAPPAVRAERERLAQLRGLHRRVIEQQIVPQYAADGAAQAQPAPSQAQMPDRTRRRVTTAQEVETYGSDAEAAPEPGR